MSGEDAALLRRVSKGEHDAFRQLYERHWRAVFCYLLSLTARHSEAEELLQDTFVAAWRQAGAFQARSTVLTWLMGIARRQARDRARRKPPPQVDLDELSAAASEAPDEAVLVRAELAEVARLIQRLSPRHREVLHLAFVEQLSYREMAQVLDVRPGTVASRLHGARDALARLLARRREEVP